MMAAARAAWSATLHMQSPCAGWQVPLEHWQGDEQFTPKKPSGQVSLQLKETEKEGKCPQDQQLPALFPILPGSPVASLAEAVTRHRVTAPPHTVGAQQLTSITKRPCGAGAVTAGSCPARLTTWAGTGLCITDIPLPAARAGLEAALAVEARRAALLAQGPVPARLAGQAEAIHG